MGIMDDIKIPTAKEERDLLFNSYILKQKA